MIRILRTHSKNLDFIELVKHLNTELKKRDGGDHAFYAQFSKTDQVKYVVLAYENDEAIGCGGLKVYGPKSIEIKRMFVSPEYRGRGISKEILSELEKWAIELSYEKCLLETGKRQFEAVGLYKKCGYKLIPNYGPYVNVENSLCFEKIIQYGL